MTLQIIPGTTIKARYAKLPILDLSERFLVQVIEPVPLAATEMSVSLVSHIIHNKTDLEQLKFQILEDWHNNLRQYTGDNIASLPDWMIGVDMVELIECDLLVPKNV